MFDYPLELGFRVVALGTRLRVNDAAGRQVGFARKKKFRLKEDVSVYRDEGQTQLLYRIKADRVLDFGATYHVSGPDGNPIGSVRRQGVRSLWRSAYSVIGADGAEVGLIHEENPWVKVLDDLVEAIPFGDALGGLIFNPTYGVELGGRPVLRVRKRRSVFESRFGVERIGELSEREEDLLLAGIIMMVILERDRG